MANVLDATYNKIFGESYVVKQPGIAKLVNTILSEKKKNLINNNTFIDNMKQKALVLGKDYQQFNKQISLTPEEHLSIDAKANKWIRSLVSEVTNMTNSDVRN